MGGVGQRFLSVGFCPNMQIDDYYVRMIALKKALVKTSFIGIINASYSQQMAVRTCGEIKAWIINQRYG